MYSPRESEESLREVLKRREIERSRDHRGRASTLTEELADQIRGLKALGLGLRRMSKALKVPISTLAGWIRNRLQIKKRLPAPQGMKAIEGRKQLALPGAIAPIGICWRCKRNAVPLEQNGACPTCCREMEPGTLFKGGCWKCGRTGIDIIMQSDGDSAHTGLCSRCKNYLFVTRPHERYERERLEKERRKADYKLLRF